jgi:beta-lactamase class A
MKGPELIFDRLRRALAARAADYPGILTVTVIDLVSGDRIDVQAHVVLGCGSSIKIPILMELCRQHVEGSLNLDLSSPHIVDKEVLGAGILQYLSPDLVLTGRDLATTMIVLSDNIATNACIDLAGLENIQALLQEITPRSQLLRKMQDYRLAAQGIENVATSADMAHWLHLLHDGKFVSRGVSDRVLEVLSLHKDGLLNRALPANLSIASKPGGLNGGKSDVGIVRLKRRPYIVSIMTAFVFDGNGAEIVIDVARQVHEHMAILARYKPMGVPHVDYFIEQGRADPRSLKE